MNKDYSVASLNKIEFNITLNDNTNYELYKLYYQ
jgi:hypothetical protein